MWQDHVRERAFRAEGPCLCVQRKEGTATLHECRCRKRLGKLWRSAGARLVAGGEGGLSSRPRFEFYPESPGKPPIDLSFVGTDQITQTMGDWAVVGTLRGEGLSQVRTVKGLLKST